MNGFDYSFDKLLRIEGGYSNDFRDRGGKTNWGVTEAVARSNGYTGDMRDLTPRDARHIFRAEYWDAMNLGAVDSLSQDIAFELFDTGVNMGIGVAAQFLQRALNVFNRSGADYSEVVSDGKIGPRTVEALGNFLAKRGKEGETVLLRAINALQGARYIDIAEKRPDNEAFVFGWFLNRVELPGRIA